MRQESPYSAARPVIGVTVLAYPEYAGRRLRDDYWRKLQAAGAIPLLLPPLLPLLAPQAAEMLDGLLLAGGGDFSAECYRQPELEPPRGQDAERDAFELALIRACWQRKLPMLGICRGMQAMNIAFGGSLHQHLIIGKNAGIEHDQSAPRQETSHRAQIINYRLAGLLGGIIEVNSHHHQAIDCLAPPFQPAAYAPDGVLEAMISRAPARYALGVQWHPEALPDGGKLFADLARAARLHQAQSARH